MFRESVERDETNIYIEGLLSLLDPADWEGSEREVRTQLIVEAHFSAQLEDLLSQWILLHELRRERVLWLKVWLSLSYAQLGRVYGVSAKEIGQWLRALRVEKLPTYPPISKALETQEVSGISCFMVEQHLSLWLDAEISDMRVITQVRQHLDRCLDCQMRLEAYRHQHEVLLRQRRRAPGFSKLEWDSALLEYRKGRRKFWRRFFVFAVGAIIVAIILGALLLSRPDRMPNIYEIAP